MLPLHSKDGLKGDDFKPGIKIRSKLASWIRQILSDSGSRNLFCFLLLNLSFAFVELAYGIWTNSLGLISDSFHMFFDCTALLAGLIASVISRWKKNERFSYGYMRAEILAGFVNALFLLFVGFFILSEAVERLFHPPHVEHERLFLVSVLGFIVNIIGIFVFHHGGGSHGHSHSGGHGHSHGKSHGHSHGGGHGHSHGGGSHGHSHDHESTAINASHHGHSHGLGFSGSCSHEDADLPSPSNQIMQGVFLHVLADTLGSVGVIISAGLIKMFGWMLADPLCSMFISVLITISVVPLLKESVGILMQRIPTGLENNLHIGYQRVNQVDGVYSIQDPHFWTLCSDNWVGNLRLLVAPNSDTQRILSQCHNIFTQLGVKQLYVQVEYSS